MVIRRRGRSADEDRAVMGAEEMAELFGLNHYTNKGVFSARLVFAGRCGAV
ncbi:MAG: hypothetical protein PVH79_04790 [Candidatus Bathyarchaeota archaeon]|jgi:hypothetical protein